MTTKHTPACEAADVASGRTAECICPTRQPAQQGSDARTDYAVRFEILADTLIAVMEMLKSGNLTEEAADTCLAKLKQIKERLSPLTTHSESAILMAVETSAAPSGK